MAIIYDINAIHRLVVHMAIWVCKEPPETTEQEKWKKKTESLYKLKKYGENEWQVLGF